MIPRLCSTQAVDDAPWLGWKLLRDILNMVGVIGDDERKLGEKRMNMR